MTDWQVAPDVTYRIWNSCGRDGRHTRRRGNMRARVQEVGKVVFTNEPHMGVAMYSRIQCAKHEK